MAFQEPVLGLKDLEHNLKAIAKMIPGPELADSLADGAWDVAIRAKQNAKAQGLADTYDLIESIKPKKVNQYRVDIEVGVPYGAAHEYGVTVVISEKQRRFFWAMYAKTKDDMWKALALSTTYTIPEKAYLRPAIDTEKMSALEHTAQSLYEHMRTAVK